MYEIVEQSARTRADPVAPPGSYVEESTVSYGMGKRVLGMSMEVEQLQPSPQRKILMILSSLSLTWKKFLAGALKMYYL